jgi:hypothetical protein
MEPPRPEMDAKCNLHIGKHIHFSFFGLKLFWKPPVTLKMVPEAAHDLYMAVSSMFWLQS